MNVQYEVLPQYEHLYKDKAVKGYELDAGFDLRIAKVSRQDAEIQSVEINQNFWVYDNIIKIATGINFEIPAGYFGQITDRSSVASKGLKVVGGVIDCGYYDEEHGIVVVLHNIANTTRYNLGDKIAQLIVLPCLYQFVAGKVEKGERANRGFGSTGQH